MSAQSFMGETSDTTLAPISMGWWHLQHKAIIPSLFFISFLLVLTRPESQISGQAIEQVRIEEALVTDLENPSAPTYRLRLDADGDVFGVDGANVMTRRSLDAQTASDDGPLPLAQTAVRNLDVNESSSPEKKCGSCNMNIKLGEKGVIQSVNYPDAYPGEQQCLWLLQASANLRLRLVCDNIQLSPCGPLGRDAPAWKDYLVISPLWSFKKSWVYCGHATSLTSLIHESICDKMAIAFRSDAVRSGSVEKGFRCTYEAID